MMGLFFTMVASNSEQVVLDATLTIQQMFGIVTSFPTPTSSTQYFDGWGFQSGPDLYIIGGTAGSLTDGDFVDGLGQTRTISALYWSELAPSYLLFSLDAINIPNLDTTFKELIVDGTVYRREDAGYTASHDGGTHWWWEDAVNRIGTSGTVGFSVEL